MNPGRRDNDSRSNVVGVTFGVRMVVRDRARLAVLLTLSGLSRRELATRAGWSSHTYLLRVLDGRVAAVGPDAAVGIAAALGAGVDDLFVPVVTRDLGRADKVSA